MPLATPAQGPENGQAASHAQSGTPGPARQYRPGRGRRVENTIMSAGRTQRHLDAPTTLSRAPLAPQRDPRMPTVRPELNETEMRLQRHQPYRNDY